MSGLEIQIQEFTSALIPEIQYEVTISGPGHFSYNFSFGILDLLIRYSVQPTKKIFNHIKKVFDDYRVKTNLQENYSYPQTETEFFFAIFRILTDNQYSYTDRLQWLQYYTKSNDENHRKGLEEGMKKVICWFFEDDMDMVDMVKADNEYQKLDRVITELSKRFQVKIVVLENSKRIEYGSALENAPIMYMKHELGKSSVLFTKDMVEMENSKDFDVERLENHPFMSKTLAYGPFKSEIIENPAPFAKNPFPPRQITNPPTIYNEKLAQKPYESPAPIPIPIKTPSPNPNLNLNPQSFQSKSCAHFQNPSRSKSPSIQRPPIPQCPPHIKNSFQLPNSTHSTISLQQPEIPDRIIDLITAMAEIIYDNKIYSENLVKKITFCTDSHNELKDIKVLGELCKLNDADKDKMGMDMDMDKMRLKDNESGIVMGPQYPRNEGFYNRQQNYENSSKIFEITGDLSYKNSDSMNNLHKVDDKISTGFGYPQNFGVSNANTATNVLPQTLPFMPNSHYLDLNSRPPQMLDFKPHNQGFIPTQTTPEFNTEIYQNPNLLSPKLSDSRGLQISNYTQSSIISNPASRYGQTKISPRKIMCQNDNGMFDEDCFLDIDCPDQCMICKKCRLLNSTQCIRCKRYYSENEKDLLDVLKISD